MKSKVDMLSEVISQIIDEKIERMTKEDVELIIENLRTEVASVILKQITMILDDMVDSCKEVLKKYTI